MAKNPRDSSMEKVPGSLKVILGSVAGMIATTLFHPLDLLKVRLQIYEKPETVKQIAERVIRSDGYRALFRGLSAGLLRQITYTSSRLAAYYFLFEQHVSIHNSQPTLNDKVRFGIYSGMVGALVGNPAEVALVRLMSDGPNGPAGQKPRYSGVFDVFVKVIRHEGVRSLWRGGALTMMRSALVSVAQIQTYAVARELMREKNVAKGLELHLFTSAISSFWTALASLPVDVVKTLYQVRTDGVTQREIIFHLARDRGIFCYWKGFFPYYIRLTFHTLVTFFILEQFCEVYRYILRYNKPSSLP